MFLSFQEKDDEAEVFYRESLKIRKDFYKDGHPSIARGLNDLARTLQHKVQFCSESVSIATSVMGDVC